MNIKNNGIRPYKIVLTMVVVMTCILLVSPPPFFLLSPGETRPTSQLVQFVDNAQDMEASNQLFYTTVKIAETTWLDIAKTSFDKNLVLTNKRQLLQGGTLETYKARSQLVMQESFYASLEVAYQYLGIEYTKEADRLYVSPMSSKAKNTFKEADQLKAVEIDGEKINISSIDGLVETINTLTNRSGRSHNIIVESLGTERTIIIEPLAKDVFPLSEQELLEYYGLENWTEIERIEAVEEQYRFQFNGEQQIGGPSAGLVMTLSFISALEPNILHTPYSVAATGTIGLDGKVGIIGSLEQKVVTVHNTGIDVFLVPSEQAEIAQKKAKSIDSALEIVGVTTLDEAIDAINALKR